MIQHLLTMREGRKLEVTEFGDRVGHPVFFFHGLIGSHHQAAYISEEAGRAGLRMIAPNRPGVGHSQFVERKTALECVTDVEDVATALGFDEFSLIGISGGTPYALAALSRLAQRVKTVTVISGMGPMHLRALCTAWTGDGASRSQSAHDGRTARAAGFREPPTVSAATPRDCLIA